MVKWQPLGKSVTCQGEDIGTDTRDQSPDLSPPRQVDMSPPRKSSPPCRRPDGLQNVELLRQEIADARERQREKFRVMDPSESGQRAETVYRDKEGRKINPKLERLKQK